MRLNVFKYCTNKWRCSYNSDGFFISPRHSQTPRSTTADSNQCLGLPGNPASASRVLRVFLDNLPLPFHLFFLLQDPRPAPFRGQLLFRPPLSIPPTPLLNINPLHALHHPFDSPSANRQHEIELRILRPRPILQNPRPEPSLDRSRTDHRPLRLVLRVELTHRPPASPQTRIQPVEKARQPTVRARIATLGVAKPLDRTDTDGRIECPRAEGDALPDVRQQQIAFHIPLERDIEHRGGNVHTDPDVWATFGWRHRGQDFARETGAAADVEDERRGGEAEEGESPVGHFDLDILDAGGGGVFAGLGVVVEEVRRAGGGGGSVPNESISKGGGGAHSVSSGRDMVRLVLTVPYDVKNRIFKQ